MRVYVCAQLYQGSCTYMHLLCYRSQSSTHHPSSSHRANIKPLTSSHPHSFTPLFRLQVTSSCFQPPHLPSSRHHALVFQSLIEQSLSAWSHVFLVMLLALLDRGVDMRSTRLPSQKHSSSANVMILYCSLEESVESWQVVLVVVGRRAS